MIREELLKIDYVSEIYLRLKESGSQISAYGLNLMAKLQKKEKSKLMELIGIFEKSLVEYRSKTTREMQKNLDNSTDFSLEETKVLKDRIKIRL